MFSRPSPAPKITTKTTILTSIISTNFISTATVTSFSVTQVPLPSFTVSASPSLKDTASLTNNAFITLILVAVSIFLSVVTITILLCFFLRRRRSRKLQSKESSLEPDPTILPRGRNRMGVAQFGELDQHSLADPTGEAIYTTDALSSNPFTAPPRTQQAESPILRTPEEPPRIPTLTGLPSISILPSTPPDQRWEGDGDVSYLTTPGQSRARPLPMYYKALKDEADRERYVAEASNVSSAGLPIIEPARSLSEHRRNSEGSIDEDTIASDIMDFGRGNGRDETRPQVGFHSTRASSGIFPDQEDDLGVGSSRVSWDARDVGPRYSVREGGGDENGRGTGAPPVE